MTTRRPFYEKLATESGPYLCSCGCDMFHNASRHPIVYVCQKCGARHEMMSDHRPDEAAPENLEVVIEQASEIIASLVSKAKALRDELMYGIPVEEVKALFEAEKEAAEFLARVRK